MLDAIAALFFESVLFSWRRIPEKIKSQMCNDTVILSCHKVFVTFREIKRFLNIYLQTYVLIMSNGFQFLKSTQKIKSDNLGVKISKSLFLIFYENFKFNIFVIVLII